MPNSYLPAVAPAAGGGLPGLPQFGRATLTGGVQSAVSSVAGGLRVEEVKQISGSAAPGWVVYESTTTPKSIYALPNLISGATGPAAATLGSFLYRRKTIDSGLSLSGNTRCVVVAVSPVNAEIIIAFTDASVRPAFARYSALGEPLQTVQINSDNASSIDVAVSVTGEFVVFWSTGTSGATGIKFARYNSVGVLQGSVTTISTTQFSTIRVAFSPLNSDIVFAFSGNYVRFNSAGVQQIPITSHGAGGGGTDGLGLAFAANGNFYIAGGSGATLLGNYFNPLGVSLFANGTATTIASVASSVHYVDVSVSQTTGIVVVAYTNTTSSTTTLLNSYTSTFSSIGSTAGITGGGSGRGAFINNGQTLVFYGSLGSDNTIYYSAISITAAASPSAFSAAQLGTVNTLTTAGALSSNFLNGISNDIAVSPNGDIIMVSYTTNFGRLVFSDFLPVVTNTTYAVTGVTNSRSLPIVEAAPVTVVTQGLLATANTPTADFRAVTGASGVALAIGVYK